MQSIFFPQIKYKKNRPFFTIYFPFISIWMRISYLLWFVLWTPRHDELWSCVCCFLLFSWFTFASFLRRCGICLGCGLIHLKCRLLIHFSCVSTNKNNKTKYSMRKNCAAFLCFFYVSRVCYRTPFVKQKETHVKCQMLCEKYYCCLPVLVTFWQVNRPPDGILGLTKLFLLYVKICFFFLFKFSWRIREREKYFCLFGCIFSRLKNFFRFFSWFFFLK